MKLRYLFLSVLVALLFVAGCAEQETKDVSFNPVVYVAYGGSDCCYNEVDFDVYEQRYVSIERTTKEITPDFVEVSEGALVDLYVYSDTACTFKVPGLGVEYDVTPGQTAKVTFEATCAGLYGMECESDYYKQTTGYAAVLSVE